jgi:hypothetical protein
VTSDRNRFALVLLACAALAAPARSAPLSPQGGDESRDLSTIADEQQHLLRQLQRLRRTMEALLPRLEQ